jgi:hypothetical protein
MKITRQIKEFHSNEIEGMTDSSENLLSLIPSLNVFNTVDGELNSLKSTTPVKIIPYNLKQYGNLQLKQFVIKGSYNSAITGNFVNPEMVSYLLKRGCRYFDFELFLVNGKVIVSYSNDPTYNILETDLPLVTFESILQTIIGESINAPNKSDPLFINMRVKSNDSSIYPLIAASINELDALGIVYKIPKSKNLNRKQPSPTKQVPTTHPHTTTPYSSNELTNFLNSIEKTLSQPSTTTNTGESITTSQNINPPISNAMELSNRMSNTINQPLITFQNKIVFIIDKSINLDYGDLCDCTNSNLPVCYDLRKYISMESGSQSLIQQPYTELLNQKWNTPLILNDSIRANVSKMRVTVPDAKIKAVSSYATAPPPSIYESANPLFSDFIIQQGCQIVPYRFYIKDPTSYLYRPQLTLADYEEFFNSHQAAFVPLGLALQYYS